MDTRIAVDETQETPRDKTPPEGDKLDSYRSATLAGERVAFTGTLASMTHRQAFELTEAHGGISAEHISRQTTMLVVGDEGWPLESDGGTSVKLEQAQGLREQGQSLRLLSEAEWLGLIGVHFDPENSRRLYTPAMLSQLLEIPASRIRAWERQGLISAAKRVYRLPYFDYHEVVGARRLAQLLAEGVAPKTIRASLTGLQSLLPSIDRPLAQLELLVRGRSLFLRDEAGLFEAESGQRQFDFGDEPAEVVGAEEVASLSMKPSGLDVVRQMTSALKRTPESQDWTVEDWLLAADELLAGGEVAAAIQALRRALHEQPTNPVLHFQLADALYRNDEVAAAAERYGMAVELDPAYIEAWTQYGCVLAQLGKTADALEALRAALDIHPDFPDAHIHLAEILQRTGSERIARNHWEQYLKFDKRGPWANLARERLGLGLQEQGGVSRTGLKLAETGPLEE